LAQQPPLWQIVPQENILCKLIIRDRIYEKVYLVDIAGCLIDKIINADLKVCDGGHKKAIFWV
jgi:hypothetical protein